MWGINCSDDILIRQRIEVKMKEKRGQEMAKESPSLLSSTVVGA